MTSFDSLAAMNAATAENFSKVKDENDEEGAFARAHDLGMSFNSYFIREAERCGRTAAIGASINILSCMVCVVASAARTADTPEAKRAAVEVMVEIIANMALKRLLSGNGVSVHVKVPE